MFASELCAADLAVGDVLRWHGTEYEIATIDGGEYLLKPINTAHSPYDSATVRLKTPQLNNYLHNDEMPFGRISTAD